MNDDVRDYLDHYFFSGEETDFAVMLNGPWGAGKTHFVKSYFATHDARLKAEDQLNGSCYLYASLYGVRSASEITDQFFAQVNPLMASKPARLLGAVAARVLNGVAGTEVSGGTDAIFKDLVTRVDDKILVFDDLERCAMSLVDVMGFINAFVEHDGLKVIVVANEDDISEDQKDGYCRKKEKLIGKTLRVSSDPKAVLDDIVSKLKITEVCQTIQREEAALLRMFVASGKPNFRSLRAVLFDYQRLVSAADHRLKEAPRAMGALLLLMIAVGVEYRSGELSIADVTGLRDAMWRRYFPKTGGDVPLDIAKANRLADTYPDVRWNDWIVPPALLAALLETGLVDVAALNEHLAKHPIVVGYDAVPAWRLLWEWYELPRSQYALARTQFLDDLNARRLTHPGVILHAAGVVIDIAEFGDPLLGPKAEAVDYLKAYVEELRAAGALEAVRAVFEGWGGGYASLGYKSCKTPEFQEIKAAVRAATFGAFAERMRLDAPALLDRLTQGPASFAALHEYGVENGNYADAPILHHLDVDAFANIAVNDWKVNGELLAALALRYEGDCRRGELADEHAWLDALHGKLLAVVAEAEPPHKRLLEVRIDHYFAAITKAVDSAKSFLAARRAEEMRGAEN